MMDHFNGLSGLELAVKLVENDQDENPCPPSLSHSGEDLGSECSTHVLSHLAQLVLKGAAS